ncbi:histidinol-phosphate aminotransferase [Roseateles sp. YR242]|uniref:pyridoxal phosphate-dependent aminotransferase n=1 Tax=Roseateles sp. YR242 TaxID=1855305 RepID=UPI0008D4A0BF|nr:aminotransferase class I/II-fold pyridoxal phosphate-dependent enzyme [Roseateles sp. YR242]SEL70478.1 histidinol-phosphate aminotransferase [Roseateles sp. YR242]
MNTRSATTLPVHGGTDAGPPVLHDFSTNAHPSGPPPAVLEAVLSADRHRYPDPAYAMLRAHLGDWHGVAPHRVVPTAGGAEAIRRLSLVALLAGIRRVCVPQPGFGDYRAAAEALGLAVVGYADTQALAAAMDQPCLVWICDPCNPTGATFSAADWALVARACRDTGSHVVVDQAYEPLRLLGSSALPEEMANRVWRLICPNKALALTGVRAAYLLAPAHETWRQRMETLASSWVLSAEGEALLRAWACERVKDGLMASRPLLRQWGDEQRARLAACGFEPMAGSVSNFWLARLPGAEAGLPPGQLSAATPAPVDLVQALRTHGIKLRDARSFQRPGWVRLSVQKPEAVDALVQALHQLTGRHRLAGASLTDVDLHRITGPQEDVS